MAHLEVNVRKPELTIYFGIRALIDSRHSSVINMKLPPSLILLLHPYICKDGEYLVHYLVATH